MRLRIFGAIRHQAERIDVTGQTPSQMISQSCSVLKAWPVTHEFRVSGELSGLRRIWNEFVESRPQWLRFPGEMRRNPGQVANSFSTRYRAGQFRVAVWGRMK